MNQKISPRLNIKSSLPKHLEALLSAYILWVMADKPFRLIYGETCKIGGKSALHFTEDEIEGLNAFFGSTDITRESSKGNPLLEAQIEHLQVGCINLYKSFSLTFAEEQRVESCERTGGERFQKELIFTSAIDLLDGFLSDRRADFKAFSKPIFTSGKLDLSSDFAINLRKVLTFLVEQSKFNDQNKITHDFLRDVVDAGGFHESGPSRIIKPFIKSGLHDYIELDGETYQGRDERELEEYSKRADFFAAIFSPNYLNDEDEDEDEQEQPTDTEYELPTYTPMSADVPLNLLLKGVPGTGKSRAIDNIIDTHFELDKAVLDSNGRPITRVLRINIHSASSNSTLMQGISVATTDEKGITYDEKVGLVLDFIIAAIQYPSAPFALILEEIQENSLNVLIGDLIYLVENQKRSSGYVIDPKEDIFDEIYRLTSTGVVKHFVTIPNLISGSVKERRLIMPSNLHFFCTSNYREEQKIIEDNLLRRFDVLELYPKPHVIIDKDVASFLSSLNEKILEDIHQPQSDRFLIGHANWINVADKKSFYKALLKFIVEFKDIKDIEFSVVKRILEGSNLPFSIDLSGDIMKNYKNLVEHIQQESGYDFVTS